MSKVIAFFKSPAGIAILVGVAVVAIGARSNVLKDALGGLPLVGKAIVPDPKVTQTGAAS